MPSSKNINIKSRGKQGDVSINEFDLNQMVDHAAMVMIAKRGSGKSWVVRAILTHFARKIPMGIIIAPTDKMNSFYADFVPDSYIYYGFKPEIIKNLLDHQIWIIEKAKERKKQGKNTNTRAFIVMDDCLSSKGDWAKDQSVSTLLFDGRHYHITYILTMQFPLGIKPELRLNFDYVFLLADDTVSNQKRIFDHYAGIFPNFESFRQVFSQLTADFGTMVIVNRGVRDNILEKIYYYKAPDLSDQNGFKIGGNQYRKFDELNYNKDWRKEQGKGFDPEVAFSKQRLQRGKLTVNKVEKPKRGSR
jgi:hypothetical protein